MADFKTNDFVLWQGHRLQVCDSAFKGILTLSDPYDPQAMYEVPVGDVTAASPVVEEVARFDPMTWKRLQTMADAARAIIAAQTKDDRKRLYTEYTQKLKCSKRTLERKVKRLQEIDSVRALAPEKGGRRDGARLLDPKVEQIIADRLNDTWLNANKPQLSDVIDIIQSECRVAKLQMPCAATVRARAASLDAYKVACRREGSKLAKYQLKALVGHIDASILLECVQIDHTPADVILVSEFDRRIPIGRPWVTLAIDVATRMVVGIYISLDAPSAISVAMCLANAILPKDEYLQLLDLKGEWPCAGVMQRIQLDNATEFHGEALRRGCGEIGVDIQYRPVGSPHYGGIIERMIGTMMGRCRMLPGATQSNVVKRGEYDAEGHAVMTLREFTAFFVNEVVNIYHLKPHRALGVPPIKRWEELLAQGHRPRQLTEGWRAAEARLAFYPHQMRLIRRTGIQLWNRTYWANDLGEWVGDGAQRPIFFDPSDVSAVFVRGPNGEILRATSTRQPDQRFSLWEWRDQQSRRRQIGRDPVVLEQLDAGVAKRVECIKGAKKATKQAHRVASKKKEHASRVKIFDSSATNVATAPDGNLLDFAKSIHAFPILISRTHHHG